MVKAERSLNPRRKGRQNRHIIKNQDFYSSDYYFNIYK